MVTLGKALFGIESRSWANGFAGQTCKTEEDHIIGRSILSDGSHFVKKATAKKKAPGMGNARSLFLR